MRRRQAVGDEDDLPVGRFLTRQELAGQAETMLDVGEVCRNGILVKVLAGKVGAQAHHRVEQ